MIKTNRFVTDAGSWHEITWIYNCGWYPLYAHPYKVNIDGQDMISQPVGIVEFFQWFNVLPYPANL